MKRREMHRLLTRASVEPRGIGARYVRTAIASVPRRLGSPSYKEEALDRSDETGAYYRFASRVVAAGLERILVRRDLQGGYDVVR
jgi:hypothetical protein